MSRYLRRLTPRVLLRALAMAAIVALGYHCAHKPPGQDLPPLRVDPFAGLDPLQQDEEQLFVLRKGPEPPPDASERVKLPFPPPPPPKRVSTPAARALKVLRTQPRGTEGLVGAVTATFNQPMVPVAALDKLRALEPPLEITPRVKGRFRWLGTTTVAFEPEDRMPFGTKYAARIPAGTRAASGQQLEREVRWTFSTPRPRLVRALPHRHSSQTKPDTAVALLFNQRVAGKDVLRRLEGNHGVEYRLVPRKRWSELKRVGPTVATWDPERTVVIKPTRPLPLDTHFRVQIKAGLRGEGPLATTSDVYHHFRTYGPLRVKGIRCANSNCIPDRGFYVSFTNPLVTTDIKRHIEVSPAPEDLEISGGGTYYSLRGSFAPRTKVTVKVGAGLRDVHGQTMDRPVEKTLTTGDLYPVLAFPARGHAVMELRGPRKVPLQVASVTSARLRMVRVRREQLLKVIQKARYSYDRDGRRDPLEGIKGLAVTRNKWRTGVQINQRGRIGISTDAGLGRRRPGVLYIELRSEQLKRFYKWANPFRGLVVSVTDIGLMARYDHDQILVLATRLHDGKPMAGVELELRDRQGKVVVEGKTDADGVARLPGRRAFKQRPTYVLWGKKGRDETFVIVDQQGVGGNYISSYRSYGYAPAKERLRMFLFTDRDPYRPGETVHLKGMLRMEEVTPAGGIREVPTALETVNLRVNSARGRKVLEKDGVELSPGGSFSVDVEIPAEGDLGTYRVYVGSLAGSAYGSFRVAAYRAPEFAVEVQTPDRDHFFGDELKATVEGEYLFGAPMSGAKASWTLRRAETSYRPPNNDGFSFGESVPYFWRWSYRLGRRGGRHGGYFVSSGSRGKIVDRGQGALDEDGRLQVVRPLERFTEEERAAIKQAGASPRRYGPATFTFEGQVVDQNRQSIANRSSVVVHPASVYVGLRTPRSVVKARQPLKVAGIVATIDGKRVAGKALTIRALQLRSKMTPVKQGGEWTYEYETREVEITRCDVTSAADPASCALTLPKPGMYLVRAEVKDARGRLARTTVTVYAHGPGYVPWRLKNQSRIELVPDRQEYRPGDVARVLVKSPLRDARGFFTLSRSGIARHELLHMQGNARVMEIKIKEEHIPGIHVGVALARGRIKVPGAKPGARDLGRPTLAHGTVKLAVSSASKRVQVEVQPGRQEVRPSGELEVALTTRDPGGRPISAEVALMVVDEGVLSLLNYQTPDPVPFFWHPRSPATGLQDGRNLLLKQDNKLKRAPVRGRLAQQRMKLRNTLSVGGAAARPRPSAAPAPASEVRADDAPAEAAGGMAKKDTGGADTPRIRSRSHFATTAYYNPSVVTDRQGRATVTVKMPDNLTTFRVMAVALDRGRADRFGKGESQVRVRKPLLLRPSLPRFLTVGDTFEAAVMVHNETDEDGAVDVLVRARNAESVDGVTRKRVTIAAHRALEVRFPMKPVSAGPTRLQFAAVLGTEVDAVEKQLPVLLPATTEAFATYGATDGSVAQKVIPPDDALPGYGGLEVSMSSTALNGLEDAVKYLVRYPHGCTEQIASRLLPLYGLKDILEDFDLDELDGEKRRDTMSRSGIRTLLSHQRHDGGWGMWAGSRISWPYVTAYTMFTLLRAREAGYPVKQRALDRGARFLKRILDNPRSEFGEQYNYTMQVIAVWALSELRKHERQHLARLYKLRKEVPVFARAWLMQAMFRAGGHTAEVKNMLRELNNAAVQTASAAHFAEQRTESLRLLMHSEDRTDAIVLYALLEVDPAHPLLPRVARGLIQSRVRGRWSTTQANAYALTALARYYKQFEKVVPDYVARLWLGEAAFLGQARFKGREMKVVQQQVPLGALRKLGEQDLVLHKQGPGKLYYRIGLRYAPRDLRLPPEEQGFALTRTYEAVEGKKDTVRRLPDGTWRVKAGAYVRVRLTVVVPDRRYFVAVMDPLPAGLEAVDASFATSASSRLGNQRKRKTYDFHSWYALFAFNHKELRDDSVVLFADRLPSGVYEYTYIARATTHGRFIAAPTKAEEMYRPETFGRTATAIVEVK